MDRNRLEANIRQRGQEFFSRMGDAMPSLFRMDWWTGRVMDACMRNEQFKVQLFRFIDVLPYLTTGDSLRRHIEEYFARDESVPGVLKWGIKGVGLGGGLAMRVLSGAIRKNLEMMAKTFIIGDKPSRTVDRLADLRRQGYAFTLDQLGEATLGESEADRYAADIHALLDALGEAQAAWPTLGGGEGALDWGHAPRINVSIKPSAMYSQAKPVDPDGSVGAMLGRLKPIYRRVMDQGGFLCIDMEMRRLKNITLDLYRRLRSDPEFRDYPHLGLALQIYMPEADGDLERLLDWSRRQGLPMSVRLVKGAYWDYETVVAEQEGRPVPVYTLRPETDMAFERAAELILRNHDVCHLACGSHNVRSVCAVMEMARLLDVPEDRYEFQVLYGMAEPFRQALLDLTPRVRLYCPHGEMLPGMAYLIRRLLENTANESFLRQTFVEGIEAERLLDPPGTVLQRERAAVEASPAEAPAPAGGPSGAETEAVEPGPFRNEPHPDWSLPEVRRAYARALDEVRGRFGQTYPLHVGGEDIETDEAVESVNPACPEEVVGRICQAGPDEAEKAVAAAASAFVTWRDTPVRERAGYLVKAGDAARRRLYELSAWQTYEAGKQWGQAYLDVCEAIDFLEYYAREMTRLAAPRYMGNVAGEVNECFYQPKGVAAVIAPWNFPLAISCGMCAAAVVAGNTVVYKPSGETPIVGHTLLQIFREAELPPGVFNYLPGRGSVVGNLLVEHPRVSLVAFTGSMEVGLDIIRKAGNTHPDQPNVKRVIAEMGGKNAIIVDDDADLDVAVPAVLTSAFGYQGQKCSACSRVIVLEAVYERFLERLLEAARSMKIGPAEDPACAMGPVISASARETLLGYIEMARQEGTVVYESSVPDGGYYVPMTIVTGITPEHRAAQEEMFGPILAVMQVRDFDQAIEWANATRFALTGGVFSRSPDHLKRCRRDFRVGNLYLNRGCTGAIVGRQPFGGFRMSGVGSKAGGPDYLLQFMNPRCVTENTMRRGFVPPQEPRGG